MKNKIKNKMSAMFQKESFWAWVFILPAFLGTLIFIIIPIFASFGLSFVDWNLISKPKIVGLENYIGLFDDPVFYQCYGILCIML